MPANYDNRAALVGEQSRGTGKQGMARFTGGWIKLHRSAIERDLGSNPILWAIWTTLLLWAYLKPSKVLWEGEQRELPPGAVIFGVKEISDKWGVSHSVVRKWLRHLHKTERIVLESCPRGMLATIRNWETYQIIEQEPCANSADNVRTACEQRATHKEVKKERNIYSEEFEVLWNKLPRGGKEKAFKGFKKYINTESKYEELLTAIDRYIAACKKAN